MTREEVLEFVALNAATNVSPSLSAAEIDQVLVQCRIVDGEGRLITDPEWVPTYWGTRAVVLCLDAKLAKASAKVDMTADGAVINASQVRGNLEALRRSWRARCFRGSV